MKIAVLGEGAWGTAVALACARQGYTVTLWCFDTQVARTMIDTRINTRYLPGHPIPTSVTITTSLECAVKDAVYYAVAIPVEYLRATCERIKQECSFFLEGTWIFLSKGVERETGFLSHDIVYNSLACQPFLYGIVVGPTFAFPFAAQEPSGFVIASPDENVACAIKKIVASPTTMCTLSSDVMGVGWCAALKNVMALGCGIVEGLSYHDNTQALFFVAIFNEVERFVCMQGGKKESCLTLAGLGDMVMTSWGALSKNKKCGRLIGQGLTGNQACAELNRYVEGIFTLYSVKKIIVHHEKEFPLLACLYNIILDNQPPALLIRTLIGLNVSI